MISRLASDQFKPTDTFTSIAFAYTSGLAFVNMIIEPKRLPYLLAIARTGGILLAAEEMRLTPSAVSQQLARLEREVGHQLVRRTPRGSVLTDAGRLLVDAAEEVERTLNLAETALTGSDADFVGMVRIGGFQSFLRAIVAPNLASWRSRYPGLQFELLEADEGDMMRTLKAGELDLVVVELDAGQPAGSLPPRMTEIPLLDEPWRFVAPARSVVGADTVDFGRIGLPWLGVESTVASARALQRVRRALGGSETSIHQYANVQTALALVAAGEGVTLVPSLALHGVSDPDVAILEVPGLGMRRLVLRQYERPGMSGAIPAAVTLIREAAAAFDFEAELDSVGS